MTRLIAALALAAAGAAHAQTRPLVENLREQVLPWWEKMDAGGTGSLIIVGDSMSFRQDSYNWFLRDRLWDRFGNAGDGYLGLATGFGYGAGNGPRPGIWRRADNSTDTVVAGVNLARNPDGYWAPDGLYTRIRNQGWFEADFYGPGAELHYLKFPGGGTLRVELDNQTIAELDTDAPTRRLGTFAFNTGAPNHTTRSTIRFESADGKWVQILGLRMSTGLPGMVYHRVARGGVGPIDFLRSANAVAGGVLAAMEPDLLVVMLDSNGGAATYPQDMDELMVFYESILPGTPTILVTHHPFSPAKEPEAETLLAIARQRGYGYINLFDLFSGLAEMEALGFMHDQVHFNAAGGRWFGDYIYEKLHFAAECLADCNGDGSLDFFDFLCFQDAFLAGDPYADCNGDGVLDFFDFLCFQNQFLAGCE